MGLTGPEAAFYVYPQAPYWPAAGGVAWDVSPTGVDFPYFDALLGELALNYCIDSTRISATGKSNGAFFVNALACHRPGVLRSIAPVAGGGPSSNCTKAISAMVVHGSADPVVAINSGRQSRDYWLAASLYTGAAPVPATPAPCISYPGTSNPVLWCQHSGAHIWPGWAGLGIRQFFLGGSNATPTPASGLRMTPSTMAVTGRLVSSKTPTLYGRATDPDDDPVQLATQVWAWNATAATGTAPVVIGTTPFVASGALASWQVTPALVNGTTYAWRAATYDGTVWNGTWSVWQVFTVRVGGSWRLGQAVRTPDSSR